MLAGGTFTISFAKALLTVTKAEMLDDPPSAENISDMPKQLMMRLQ